MQTSINKTQSKDVALNEVVIRSGSIAQLIEFEVYVNETFVYRQKADGILLILQQGQLLTHYLAMDQSFILK